MATLTLGRRSTTVFTLTSVGTIGSSPSGGRPVIEICVLSLGA
jgi:hypothetical protein